MRISVTPPAGWDLRIVSAVLSRDFAAAMARLGWRPLYAWDDSDLALVFVRRLPVFGLGGWTTRARVYLNEGYPMFVRELQEALADEGAAYAVFGDTVWPLPPHLRAGLPKGATVLQHRIVHDIQRSDEAMLAGMHGKLRTNVRRTARNGVRVTEISAEAELDDFLALGVETATRMRDRQVVSALPDGFFRTILRTMVPRGDAVFLLARSDSRALAGGLFLKLGTSFTYYHGVSTRHPALVAFEGPTAIFWHAMRYARSAGFRVFDHGAVTVTDDVSHPNYSVYAYKRRFGGRLEEIATGHVVLSRARHAFQQRVLMPVWKRVYPLYMRWNAGQEETVRAA